MPNPAVDGTPRKRGGSVSLCALGSASQRTGGMISVSGPSSDLWIPTLYLRVPGTPKFYCSKFTTGCKWPGRFCYCWCHYCTLHNLCLRAWFWPVSSGWDQAPCSQPFPASPGMPWLLPVQGSPAQGSCPRNTTDITGANSVTSKSC